MARLSRGVVFHIISGACVSFARACVVLVVFSRFYALGLECFLLL